MGKRKHEKNIITKKEVIRRMSAITGFTQENCRYAIDAITQIMTEVMLEDRAMYFFKLGWLEPYTRKGRKYYRLDENGIVMDENGNKVEYRVPDTTWLRFRMSERFKHLLNPGVYDDLPEEDE